MVLVIGYKLKPLKKPTFFIKKVKKRALKKLTNYPKKYKNNTYIIIRNIWFYV